MIDRPAATADSLADRREFLARGGTGLGAIALGALLGRDRDRRPHHAPKAERVLVIFCSGALSHVDTFDFKPALLRRHGQPLPGAEKLVTFQGEQGALTRSPWTFRPRGASGKHTSDLLPNLGSLADELCFVHSMTTTSNTHGPAENVMSTGFALDGFPSAGAWVSYALGSPNADLPAFVAIPDPRGVPQSSGNNWGSGFLPASFQGTPLSAQRGVAHLERPATITAATDRATRAFAARLDARHLERHGGDPALRARIASYELAARMQLSVPEVLDLGGGQHLGLEANQLGQPIRRHRHSPGQHSP